MGVQGIPKGKRDGLLVSPDLKIVLRQRTSQATSLDVVGDQ